MDKIADLVISGIHIICTTGAITINIISIIEGNWNFAIGQGLIVCPVMAYAYFKYFRC